MSDSNESSVFDGKIPELTSDQLTGLDQFKRWVETEIDVYGRPDERYLLLFFRSRDFNLELTKTTFRINCENRKKLPKWFTNRDVRNPNLQNLVKKRIVTALIETEVHQPSVTVLTANRMGPDRSMFDDIIKLIGICMEVVAKRRCSQTRGNVYILDIKDCPWWLFQKMLWPSFYRNLFNVFVYGFPIRTLSFVLVNAPFIASIMVAIGEPFFSSEFKVHLISDWSKIGSVVPLDRLPTEVGGTFGSMKHHEDTFIEEVMKMSEELVKHDEKYGFGSKAR